NSSGIITEANSSAANALGSTSELHGRIIDSLFGEEPARCIYETIESAKDFWGKEISLRNREDEEIDCLLSCWTHDSVNKIVIGVVSDISQQKHNERQQQ